MLAISEVEVEYVGANAHATLAWEGINALDAAVLAYNNISALRQQVNPSHRIHGIIQGSEDWVCNSESSSHWIISLSAIHSACMVEKTRDPISDESSPQSFRPRLD